jgi:hypothetical protein
LQLNAPGQYRSKGLRAFDPDVVPADVEVGQRGTDQIKPNRNAEKRG